MSHFMQWRDNLRVGFRVIETLLNVLKRIKFSRSLQVTETVEIEWFALECLKWTRYVCKKGKVWKVDHFCLKKDILNVLKSDWYCEKVRVVSFILIKNEGGVYIEQNDRSVILTEEEWDTLICTVHRFESQNETCALRRYNSKRHASV